jgi:ESCO1/2 acetyl-transferase/zinc-finger of acetyl-transferase ESCO
MTLDLGLPATTTCLTCGMSYTPSQPSDLALHAKHHAKRLAAESTAPAIPLPIYRALEKTNKLWSSGQDSIVRVTPRDDVARRNIAEKILRAATLDLGAVDIASENIWAETLQTGISEAESSRTGRFQIFLYLKGRKCAGLLLAERISSGLAVVNSDFPIITEDVESSSTFTVRKHPAMLGISRIWTHKSERRNGIALKLLEACRSSFKPLFMINKEKVAFSQPTEQGAALARKWFGRDKGWLVYTDISLTQHNDSK